MSNAGIEPGMDIRFSKKIKITNEIAMALSIIASCYIFIFSFVGFVIEGLGLIPIVGTLLLSVFFNHKKWYYLSRTWCFSVVIVAVYIYAYTFGKRAGIQLVFIPCACLPWIYFELKDLKYILSCSLISISSLFLYHFSNVQPQVPITSFAEEFIYITIVLAVFSYIFLCMRFLSVQNNKAEQFLVDTYQQFFEDIPTPMWIFDTKTLRFLAVNQNAIDSYGFSKDEFLKMTLTDIHPTERQAENEKAIQNKIINDRNFDSGYIQHKKKNGDIFYAHVLTNSTVFNNVEARVVQAIDVNDKILTEKKLEELRISQEQLKAREEELSETVKQKDTINKQLERFTYIVAHDIKSPLNSVLSILSALRTDKRITTDDELNYKVHGMVFSANLLSEMIDSILDYSKKSDNELEDVDVDVNEMVSKIAAVFLPQKHINIRTEGILPYFKTKKLKLQQVFQNLISNAIKYNDKENGEITVGHEDDGDFYKFYVKDNGLGIKKKDVERIFYLFQTTENESKNGNGRASGTRVDLNILKMLVEEQGGKIYVESTPTFGSCFYFQWRKQKVA